LCGISWKNECCTRQWGAEQGRHQGRSENSYHSGNRYSKSKEKDKDPYQPVKKSHQRDDNKQQYQYYIGGDIEIQSSLDDTSDFYNTDAINGDYSKAQKDQYGNPVGGEYDLAKDGAFKGFRVLIGCFYLGEGLPESMESLTIPELIKKGFEVILLKNEADFIKCITTEKFHCAWIISSNSFSSSNDKFHQVVMKYHELGRGFVLQTCKCEKVKQ